jgi:signal transduction histidine kinase
MRFNRLYTKILFSFLAVLVVAEIIILILFVVMPGKRFSTRLEHYSKNKALIVKAVVEEKIQSAPGADWSKNVALKVFIEDFGKILGARVWLRDRTGAIVLKSFSDEVPSLVRDLKEEKLKEYGGFRLFSRRDSDYYAVVPIAVSGSRAGSIHVLLNRQAFPPPRGYFVSAILILGLVIALSIIPVTRLITRRIKKLRYSALRIATGDLSHRVRIRGHDEISDLALAFNGMADKLESMIVSGKELTANVSHELRSPLARIRVAEEMLREKLAKANVEDWDGYLDAIREDIEEIDGLIGRILEVSKLDMYESPLRSEPLDPSNLVRSLLEKLRPVIDRKELHLVTELSHETPFAGDEEALRSALMNIIENATKFAPHKGDISVHMRWKPDSLEIRVANTFEKLSEEDLLRIFNPFHRVQRSAAAGSGLGLTIARKIVERHGGSMVARNAQEGLEIFISLPRDGNRP